MIEIIWVSLAFTALVVLAYLGDRFLAIIADANDNQRELIDKMIYLTENAIESVTNMMPSEDGNELSDEAILTQQNALNRMEESKERLLNLDKEI